MARGAQAFRGTTQSIPSNTQTTISFSTVNFDTDLYWAAGSPTRLTVPAGLAGQYVITACLIWANNATGDREIRIKKNGTTILSDVLAAGAPSGNSIQNVTALAVLASGDFIELEVNQISGAALVVNSSAPDAPTLALSFMGN